MLHDKAHPCGAGAFSPERALVSANRPFTSAGWGSTTAATAKAHLHVAPLLGGLRVNARTSNAHRLPLTWRIAPMWWPAPPLPHLLRGRLDLRPQLYVVFLRQPGTS